MLGTWGRPGRWGPGCPPGTRPGLGSQASAADPWCRRHRRCPPGPRARPCQAQGDTGGCVQPGMLPGPRSRPSARASRARGTWPPRPQWPCFLGQTEVGGTLTAAIEAPDGRGLAWGRPMRGPLGVQGPEPHGPTRWPRLNNRSGGAAAVRLPRAQPVAGRAPGRRGAGGGLASGGPVRSGPGPDAR